MLVHVGFALSRIDEQAALETLRTLAEIGELQRPRLRGGRARPGERLMRHVDEYRDDAAVARGRAPDPRDREPAAGR